MQWYIWDFPDKIFLLIKEEIRQEFFEAMFKIFGSKKEYAKFLNRSLDIVESYRLGKFRKSEKKLLPVEILKKSLKFIQPKLKTKIEKNIRIMRGVCGTELISPKLPIKESPELYRILAHLIGDGSAPDNHQPYYCNSNKQLINDFQNDLFNVFGNLKTRLGYANPTPAIFFSKSISDILSYIFNIRFSHPDHIPKLIFNSARKYKREFLRALYDDEGTASPHLGICFKNYNLIKEVKELVNSLGIKTSELTFKNDKLKGKPTWSFIIKVKDLKKFRRIIGFSHIKRKKELDLLIEIRDLLVTNRKLSLEEIKGFVLKSISAKSKTAIQLSREFKFGYHRIYNALNKLESELLIKRSGYKNNIIWTMV